MTPLWLHITVFLLFCFFWQYFGYQKKKSIEAFQRIGKSPNNSYSIAGYKISIERAARRLDENDWRFLEQCLTHPDLQVAAWASGALSKLEDSRAVEILMNHIQRLDEEISSSKTTKSAQSNFISSPEPGINQSIHWNFIHSAIIENEDQLSREYSFPPLNQQSPGILRDFLQRIADDNSQKEAIRFHALESMKSLVDPPPQHFLESLLESNEPLVLQGTLSLVGFYEISACEERTIHLLKHSHPGIVLEAIYAVKELNSASSLSPLNDLQSHPNSLIRQAAKNTAEQIREALNM